MTFRFDPHETYFGAPKIITTLGVRPVTQAPSDMKPRGFWYAVGGEWWQHLEWDAKQWWDDYREVHVVRFDRSRILRISSVDEAWEFAQKYGAPARGPFSHGETMNWLRVSQDYAGVEIAPYIWSLRDDYIWYYAWDVASGCIWDANAITGIEHVGTMPPLKPRR